MKTAAEIREILNGEFSSESDRAYWVEQLEKAEARERAIENNDRYFAEMVVYNR